MKNILLSLLFLWVLAVLAGFAIHGAAMAYSILLTPLILFIWGPIVGIPLGIKAYGLSYLFGITASILCVAGGLFSRRHVWGQAVTVLGVLFVLFLMVLGLGQGG